VTQAYAYLKTTEYYSNSTEVWLDERRDIY
jgi:hypothetical protein